MVGLADVVQEIPTVLGEIDLTTEFELGAIGLGTMPVTFPVANHPGQGHEISLRNSPGILGWSEVPSDWVRPGIMLYGATPFGEDQAVAARLQPVMTLESKLIAVRELPAGESVGYIGANGAGKSTTIKMLTGILVPTAGTVHAPSGGWG